MIYDEIGLSFGLHVLLACTSRSLVEGHDIPPGRESPRASLVIY